MSEYQDRFDAALYTKDQGVSLTLRGLPAPEGSFTMPERIFERAQQIAAAYELHVLPLIDYYDEVRLNKDQLKSLQDELAFIRSVVNDPLLDTYIQGAQQLVLTGLRTGRNVELVVEGP
jgi:hypothetical protein